MQALTNGVLYLQVQLSPQQAVLRPQSVEPPQQQSVVVQAQSESPAPLLVKMQAQPQQIQQQVTQPQPVTQVGNSYLYLINVKEVKI